MTVSLFVGNAYDFELSFTFVMHQLDLFLSVLSLIPDSLDVLCLLHSIRTVFLETDSRLRTDFLFRKSVHEEIPI